MTSRRHGVARVIGIAFAVLFAIQLVLFERGVFDGTRFVNPPGLAAVVGLVGALLYLATIAFTARIWRPSRRIPGYTLVAVAALATVRFHLPRLVLNHQAAQPLEHRLAANQSPRLVSYLRQLASAEEQYRLKHGAYSASADSLLAWSDPPAGTDVRIVTRGDKGWSAQASLAGITCSVWVRDMSLRKNEWQPEGSPTCGKPEQRIAPEHVPTLVAPAGAEMTSFSDSDIRGTWLQHRADERRTGIVAGGLDAAGYRWDARIGGSIRSSVAIAGNQVFVGAHGNGELVALTLDSGKIGFRVRAPNWLHHEAVVTEDLIIVGFGNNEWVKKEALGSEPSGVAAYDRRTGEERWHTYLDGSVMGSPIVADSVVAVATGGHNTVGMRLRDGAILWRTNVADMSPMSNPLLLDTLMLVSLEKTNACAIVIRSGRRVYCRSLGADGWGTGHASPAVAGGVVLQLVADKPTFDPQTRTEWLTFTARRILGLGFTQVPNRAGQTLVAFEPREGRVLWRSYLGPGVFVVNAGHIAGTPTVVGNVAYVPLQNNGHVVAVDTRSGRVAWSSPVKAARGSVVVLSGAVTAATLDTGFVVLDAATGSVTCRQRLPARSDRAGLTVSGGTGILTLGNGTVMARPLSDWLACRA